MKIKTCEACEEGEHENYNDDVRKYRVVDPDSKKQWTNLLCQDHVCALLDDGYEVTEL